MMPVATATLATDCPRNAGRAFLSASEKRFKPRISIMSDVLSFSVGKPPEDDWREKVRKAVRYLADGLQDRHVSDIREHIVKAAREALGPDSGSKMKGVIEVSGDHGIGTKSVPAFSAAGVFRLVLLDSFIDRNDSHAAESFMDEVQREINRELN
jgi:hypothetical protein